LAQPGKLELKVLDPVKQEIQHESQGWETGAPMAQSVWAIILRQFTQNGTYTFELWDDAAHRLAYTELDVERM
jgi:hypothetical protein